MFIELPVHTYSLSSRSGTNFVVAKFVAIFNIKCYLYGAFNADMRFPHTGGVVQGRLDNLFGYDGTHRTARRT